jgi:hypothetical protein
MASKESKIKYREFYIAIIISVVIIGFIVIFAYSNLNKKVPYNPPNNSNIEDSFDLNSKMQSILDSEKNKQMGNSIEISFNNLRVEGNNSYFTINCSSKLDFQKEQGIIMNLANTLYQELPDIYGKSVADENPPKVEIISGANCMFREGWTISKGYIGTKLID